MRPALTDKGLLAEVESVMQEREPLYRSAAHFSMATDKRNIQGLCKEIIAKLNGVTS
jgi:shikimate kinase